MSNHDVITFNQVSFAYQKITALKDVNLKVAKGEFTCIVGPNGGGKTTLLKLILGLVQPENGTISILGQTPTMARKRVGYMPQYAHLDPAFPASVMDVVLMGRLTKGRFFFNREDKKKALGAISHVGLSDLAFQGFHELSGGQRQRALIARALCSEPELLLLDEPMANVDHQTEENLMTVLKSINQDITILLVSHDLGFVSRHVKQVICVNHTVVTHPTSQISGTMIQDIYNQDLIMVRHDQQCGEKENCCD
ncbi:MAG: ABC transporter ATP-binding protein [Proteobacteria bacterium]|nr:ABC transporter ATP-binding protein [Pseudomonadota bacterium]